MSYIDRVLQRGEVVRYRGSVSPAIYIPALIMACVGALIAGMSIIMPWPFGWFFVAIFLILAIMIATSCWFKRWTTELAVTDRRVIYARGFITRKSVEMNMRQIESVDVDQSVLGRLLDFGTVTIVGAGTTHEPIPDIDQPLVFRNAVTAA
jgi:uncharacterized membrane protein YdbT with pleckstrin-like domain